MMNKTLRSKFGLLLACAFAAVSGCGVGNDKDEAGSLTEFNVVPDVINVVGAKDACPPAFVGGVGRAYVFGGTAPYDVFSTDPGLLSPTPTKVEHPEGFIDITVASGGGCFKSILVVVDKWGRQKNVTVNGIKGT